MTKCVVLWSATEYTEEKSSVLREILRLEPDLFAVVGVDCAAWEEAMDWLYVEQATTNEQPTTFCNTTSHPGETLSEVVAFAEQWCDLKGWNREVAVVEI